MEVAIKYFTIFGGLEEKIDISIPLNELIETLILTKYDHYRKEINYLIGGYGVEYAVLTGIALGDRKTTTAFKRAHVSFEEGMKCVENLVEKEIIEIESSQYFLLNKRNESKVAKKLFFTTPFIRFWFGFISPIYKGIKEGDFKEFYTRLDNYIGEFSNFIFEELSLIFLQNYMVEDRIKNIGKFWDDKIEIDIVARTLNNKLIVANCKYTNNKIKKSELTKLTQDSETLGISPDMLILFSKSGFTSELKSLKNENLKLFTAKHFKLLLN
ncbi:MAG: DUF234 domain-containing protein [Arcobacteraceae bacterium]|jgi:hypothetical protein|nr:DUF234 domain-containing protein [Arcobacteraceae bacterium]